MNDTSTSLIHSDLMSLGARVPSKKMSGGSESLRLSSDVREKGRLWSVSYSGISVMTQAQVSYKVSCPLVLRYPVDWKMSGGSESPMLLLRCRLTLQQRME